ncbi:hypothetical protein MPH_08966 [Macrophomina phaseolina MS6]|uniref:Uncharacterized protein n=1 Tax=Macrophomina phaseolina (strain MS6) TaxID=1126212 RepID=K2RH09_MACPH|nr:hypothetical protein MPH_08966 [Macrophomina phaseolina MS6]
MICEPRPSLKHQVSSDSYGSHRTNGSQSSSASSTKKLLFGEIPTPEAPGSRSLRSNSSVCNLVMSTSSAFLRFWLSESCRDAFLAHVDKTDLANCRLVCHDMSSRAAPFLFQDITITFRPSTFARPARMEALERVGHHVRAMTFRMPHSPETFLPPLIDPATGEQKSLVYEPQIHKPPTLIGKMKTPKYGSWEMTDLLIKQYPPVFHAATNVPAFIRALMALPALIHLRLDCPGQDPAQRRRRSAVDYALISLRIAVERAQLPELDTMTIKAMHPAGLLYLQPSMGPGSTPASNKRWRQIRKLAVHLDSLPYTEGSSSEHLRILHSYLRTFSSSLTRLLFRWRGEKGPSPLSLDLEPGLSPPSTPESGASRPTGIRALKFPHLLYLELENAVMDSSQISTFILRHRRSITEFNFEDVSLRTGTWDDALAPLTRIAGSEEWKNRAEEVMDVPIILSPVDEIKPDLLITDELDDLKTTVSQSSVSKWWSRTRSSKVTTKAKEQLFEAEEHMRKFLFPWR